MNEDLLTPSEDQAFEELLTLEPEVIDEPPDPSYAEVGAVLDAIEAGGLDTFTPQAEEPTQDLPDGPSQEEMDALDALIRANTRPDLLLPTPQSNFVPDWSGLQPTLPPAAAPPPSFQTPYTLFAPGAPPASTPPGSDVFPEATPNAPPPQSLLDFFAQLEQGLALPESILDYALPPPAQQSAPPPPAGPPPGGGPPTTSPPSSGSTPPRPPSTTPPPGAPPPPAAGQPPAATPSGFRPVAVPPNPTWQEPTLIPHPGCHWSSATCAAEVNEIDRLNQLARQEALRQFQLQQCLHNLALNINATQNPNYPNSCGPYATPTPGAPTTTARPGSSGATPPGAATSPVTPPPAATVQPTPAPGRPSTSSPTRTTTGTSATTAGGVVSAAAQRVQQAARQIADQVKQAAADVPTWVWVAGAAGAGYLYLRRRGRRRR